MTEVSDRERADEAFTIVAKALDAAMSNRFPVGIDAVEYYLQVKGSVQYLAEVLKRVYEPKPEPEVAVSKECETCDEEYVVGIDHKHDGEDH